MGGHRLVRGLIFVSTMAGGCRIGFDPLDPGVSEGVGVDSSVLPAADAAQEPMAQLRVWLPMDDEIADGVVKDRSGNNAHATCTGACPKLVPGRIGLAVSDFSPNATGLELPDGPHWHLAQFSLAAWARFTRERHHSDHATIISKPLRDDEANSYQLQIRSTGQLACMVTNASGRTLVTAPDAFPIREWTHTACTYDGSMLRLYINGQLVGAPALAVGIDYDTHSLYVGADRNAGKPAQDFDGDLDEVRVYDGVLSDAELAQLAH
jgi:hypothetical protein